MKNSFFKIIIISFAFFSCQNNTEPIRTATPLKKKEAIELAPIFTASDKKLADVFKKYEGTWKGNYITIKDIDPLLKTSIDLENLRLDYVTKPGLTLMNNYEAEHVFLSKSPYFQEISFYDFYPRERKTISTAGNNRVENGKIYRYLTNLNESITLNGTIKNDSTIVWLFEQEKPQRIEFYQETISENFIEVIGYKYDELDRLDLGPKKWFYGKFVKALSEK
ncbi:MAG: hypothetical protein P8M17_00975 [Saprospiraceae bacterium]|nr:hypothetical protein [Saprospiraceae bacterium]